MAELLEQTQWLFDNLPADGKQVLADRLTAEVEFFKEQYASVLPQVSLSPEDAVSELGLYPPVEDEEVPTVVATDKPTSFTTAPDYSVKANEEVAEEVVEDKTPVTTTATKATVPAPSSPVKTS